MSAYCTPQEIRDRGVTAEAAPDEAVEKAIARATRTADVFAGRDFLKREATYRVDGNGTESVLLDDRPVVEVLDLRLDDYLLTPESYVLYPDAGYIRLNGARRSIFAGFPGIFPKGARNVEVHGFFGFEAVPAEVNEAAILLAIEFLRIGPAEADVAAGSSASTRNAIGIRRVRIDEISVDFEYPSDLKAGSGRVVTTGLPKADALLSRFRQWLHPVAV
ncbi:MAG: hypothetical protein C4529_07945 [Deltaproteobacteria bacterium]|nr:MAG: hypothetical protein C4529_07945 [Deltaproteobacteria bacterium]